MRNSTTNHAGPANTTAISPMNMKPIATWAIGEILMTTWEDFGADGVRMPPSSHRRVCGLRARAVIRPDLTFDQSGGYRRVLCRPCS
ncbi:hypothetical protein MPRF_50910 [Mycolicibacterium parafortuitum]|uniref:Uncharacterized protein n=1 Tax=Mycolicibacterium parafortuitum TaxID=39692 RepID=A0A7I7U9Z3_MYCPF|nr:hypothetical protein MPRF_50910 [Mycolicibacterium parafortuitum]